MEFKTSKKVYGFTAIAIACAGLGGMAQISQNLSSSQAEAGRSKQLTVVSQHKLSNTCRPLNGGQFQIGEQIQEEGGQSPTACYKNEIGEFAFAAYQGGKLTIVRVYSDKEVQARLSEMKGEKK